MDIPKLTKTPIGVPLATPHRGSNVKIREVAGAELEVDLTDSESDIPVLLSGPNGKVTSTPTPSTTTPSTTTPSPTMPYASLSNRSVTYSSGEDTVIVESGDEHFITKHKITFKLYNSQLAYFLRHKVLSNMWYRAPFDFTRHDLPSGVEYSLDVSYKTLTNIDWKLAMMLGEYLHCLSRIDNININSKQVALKVCLLDLMLAEALVKFPKSEANKHLDSFVEGLIEATIDYDFIKLNTDRDTVQQDAAQKDAALDDVHLALGEIRKILNEPIEAVWRNSLL